MCQVIYVGDITAVSRDHKTGSEVLLFGRKQGFLARVIMPQRGELLKRRLEFSIERILCTN
jgi:hypothetical protein